MQTFFDNFFYYTDKFKQANQKSYLFQNPKIMSHFLVSLPITFFQTLLESLFSPISINFMCSYLGIH